MASTRVNHGGRIDRSQAVSFRFDGHHYTGFAGDTLASALLANGVQLFGRSFKLHRPRGVLAAGVEEPNALVTLRTGGRREPNIQAPMVEICPGLSARSQNCWPNLRFDALAVNNALASLLPAGFYYKTFMGPTRRSWMLYEPWIRRAAGLGRAADEPDPDRYERQHAFCDVLVVGSGPAGLNAALAAGRTGARVILVEQQPNLGGELLSDAVDSDNDRWRRARIAELGDCANVRILHRTTAFGLYDGNVVGAVERVHDHDLEPPAGQPRQRLWTIHPARIVLATGATERPLLFGNNDRPGVMLASAARRYLHDFAVRPGQRVTVYTNNDSAYATACDLQAAGATVRIVDSRSAPSGSATEYALNAGVAVHPDSRLATVTGKPGITGVRIVEGNGRSVDLASDLVCVSGGWSPNVHLASHRGDRPTYRPEIGAFALDELPAGIAAAGAVCGELGTAEAARAGGRAGLAAAATDAHAPAPADAPNTTLLGYVAPTAAGETNLPETADKIFVDLQNDVSTKDVKLAWREGYQSIEHLKRYTTLGMGTDQGRTSNINGMKLMAGLREQDVPTTGTTTFRPPFTPVALGTLVGRRVREHFRPERRTPMHDLHRRRDARFTCAGAWLRVHFYSEHGATASEAYLPEMRAVRENVGMADVSTLGKIDVQGPDAAEFLSRVYVNGWKKLGVGRCRYGVMLRDDGIALDDGTTSRISEHHYFMTTTTGEAAEVMSWLEFLLDTAWPELRVQVTSVTDQWAAVAVAGPNSGQVVAAALPGVDVGDNALSPMGLREGTTNDGLPVRVLRVSFSGERAYEVYTPAGFGAELWQRIAEAGAPFAIQPYGLEALGALRIEKGHPVAAEIDGRTTLEDLGLGGIAREDQPFVGQTLRQRPALQAAERPRLVGLRSVDPQQQLRPGALLFPEDTSVEGHGLGYISSATWSPTLACWIALGFIAGGRERLGTRAVAASPVHGEHVTVDVVSPVFLDPEGERLHA